MAVRVGGPAAAAVKPRWVDAGVLSASSNDPTMKLRGNGNAIVITGKASNTGTVASRLSVSLTRPPTGVAMGGPPIEVSVPVSKGETPKQAANALAKAIRQAGYKATVASGANGAAQVKVKEYLNPLLA